MSCNHRVIIKYQYNVWLASTLKGTACYIYIHIQACPRYPFAQCLNGQKNLYQPEP